MPTPGGPVCDYCYQPLPNRQGVVMFWFTHLIFCSTACAEAALEAKRKSLLRRSRCYALKRGWIDTAGRCRTWQIVDAEGSKIAEVTTLKGAKELLSRLTQR